MGGVAHQQLYQNLVCSKWYSLRQITPKLQIRGKTFSPADMCFWYPFCQNAEIVRISGICFSTRSPWKCTAPAGWPKSRLFHLVHHKYRLEQNRLEQLAHRQSYLMQALMKLAQVYNTDIWNNIIANSSPKIMTIIWIISPPVGLIPWQMGFQEVWNSMFPVIFFFASVKGFLYHSQS